MFKSTGNVYCAVLDWNNAFYISWLVTVLFVTCTSSVLSCTCGMKNVWKVFSWVDSHDWNETCTGHVVRMILRHLSRSAISCSVKLPARRAAVCCFHWAVLLWSCLSSCSWAFSCLQRDAAAPPSGPGTRFRLQNSSMCSSIQVRIKQNFSNCVKLFVYA